jgi:hypothetical protein
MLRTKGYRSCICMLWTVGDYDLNVGNHRWRVRLEHHFTSTIETERKTASAYVAVVPSRVPYPFDRKVTAEWCDYGFCTFLGKRDDYKFPVFIGSMQVLPCCLSTQVGPDGRHDGPRYTSSSLVSSTSYSNNRSNKHFVHHGHFGRGRGPSTSDQHRHDLQKNATRAVLSVSNIRNLAPQWTTSNE